MAGIIPNIALTNNFDANGEIMSGALLRIYLAGTNNEVTAYKDSGLTAGQEHPWPIEADSAGRIPMFWLDDGSYRIRLSSSDGGTIAYDVPIIATVGASSGDGGGGGDGVSSEVIWQTGDLKSRYGTGTHAGFVRANGRTIGSATSGATERANADTQSLFEYLWATSADTILAVSGGRGLSAAADFSANKAIALPDWRGCPVVGLDDMGATAAGRLTTATFSTSGQGPTVLGALGGAQTKALATTNLPAFTPSGTIAVTVPDHTHFIANSTTSVTDGTNEIAANTSLMKSNSEGQTNGFRLIGSATTPTLGLTSGATGAAASATFTGTAQGGAATAFGVVQPSRLATIYIKL